MIAAFTKATLIGIIVITGLLSFAMVIHGYIMNDNQMLILGLFMVFNSIIPCGVILATLSIEE